MKINYQKYINSSYNFLDIVEHKNKLYIAKQFVPKSTPLNNLKFWGLLGYATEEPTPPIPPIPVGDNIIFYNNSVENGLPSITKEQFNEIYNYIINDKKEVFIKCEKGFSQILTVKKPSETGYYTNAIWEGIDHPEINLALGNYPLNVEINNTVYAQIEAVDYSGSGYTYALASKTSSGSITQLGYTYSPTSTPFSWTYPVNKKWRILDPSINETLLNWMNENGTFTFDTNKSLKLYDDNKYIIISLNNDNVNTTAINILEQKIIPLNIIGRSGTISQDEILQLKDRSAYISTQNKILHYIKTNYYYEGYPRTVYSDGSYDLMYNEDSGSYIFQHKDDIVNITSYLSEPLETGKLYFLTQDTTFSNYKYKKGLYKAINTSAIQKIGIDSASFFIFSNSTTSIDGIDVPKIETDDFNSMVENSNEKTPVLNNGTIYYYPYSNNLKNITTNVIGCSWTGYNYQDVDVNWSYNVNFTDKNNNSYVKLAMEGNTAIYYYKADGTKTKVWDTSSRWLDESFKTISFTGGDEAYNPSFISRLRTFGNLFNPNSYISFIIGDALLVKYSNDGNEYCKITSKKLLFE